MIAKYIIFNRNIRSYLKVIASIFTDLLQFLDSLTRLSILPRLFVCKYNSLLSRFCKIEIPIKFAFNEKCYTYVTIIEH